MGVANNISGAATGKVAPTQVAQTRKETGSQYGSVSEGKKQGTGATIKPYTGKRVVDEAETVSGQIGKAMNGPGRAQIEQRTMDQAAARGLQNSTMGQQAGAAAWLDTAQKRAEIDAGVNERANQTQFEADSLEGRTRLQGDLDTGKQVLQGEIDAALIQEETNAREHLMGIEQLNQVDLQNLRGEQAIKLANIDADNKLLIQSSGSAAELYSRGMDAIADVMANDDLSAMQQQAGVDRIIDMLHGGLQVIELGGKVDLTGILNFDVPPAAETTKTAPATSKTTGTTSATGTTSEAQTPKEILAGIRGDR